MHRSIGKPGFLSETSEVSPEICNKKSRWDVGDASNFHVATFSHTGSFSSWRRHLQLKNDWFQLWHLCPKEHKIHWTTSPSPGMRPQPNTLFRHRGPPSPKLSHCRKPTSILSWLSCSPHLELLGLGRQAEPGMSGVSTLQGKRGFAKPTFPGLSGKTLTQKGTFGICIWICFFIPRMDPMFVILPLKDDPLFDIKRRFARPNLSWKRWGFRKSQLRSPTDDPRNDPNSAWKIDRFSDSRDFSENFLPIGYLIISGGYLIVAQIIDTYLDVPGS